MVAGRSTLSSRPVADPRVRVYDSAPMKKLLGFLGATVGGWIGWWLGAHVGIMTAFMVSMVGTGAGIYAGARVADHYGI